MLTKESVVPSETVTFDEIMSWSWSKLKSSCGEHQLYGLPRMLYGLPRIGLSLEKRPAVERMLARAAAAFHPGDPEWGPTATTND